MKNRAGWAAAGVVAAALASIAMGADSKSGGAAPYSPTQGEWLCMLLNMDEAAADEMQFPQGVGIRYRYDHDQPDTIEIDVLYNVNVGAAERQNRAKHAERQARELAKLRGWDGWLKLEVKEAKVTNFPGAKPLEK
jgi:hypothetical protein